MPKVKKSKSNKSRSWCITSYKESIKFPKSIYSIVGKEICPTTKRRHLQCYVYYKNARSFKSMKKEFPGCHIEVSKGSPESNREYCSKDGDFVEEGNIPKQGLRTDLEHVYYMAKENKKDTEISDAYPSTYMKYYKAIDRVKFNFAQEDTKFEPIEVLVFVGDAGSGKSRQARELDPNLYCLDLSRDVLWFDGYTGQHTILLDDFYGNIKYGYLLRLLDGYKFQLPIKGGFTWKRWKRVIITSNNEPENWYKNGMTPALERRITSVSKFENPHE